MEGVPAELSSVGAIVGEGGGRQATGHSANLSFDEAFRDALENLPDPGGDPVPDELLHVRVDEIGGLFGGFPGFHYLYVKVIADVTPRRPGSGPIAEVRPGEGGPITEVRPEDPYRPQRPEVIVEVAPDRPDRPDPAELVFEVAPDRPDRPDRPEVITEVAPDRPEVITEVAPERHQQGEPGGPIAEIAPDVPPGPVSDEDR